MLDEVCSNIVRHSRASAFEVDVEVTESPKCVKMTFIDDGTPYDPLTHTDPDVKASAEERPVGGLGIFIVKKTMDSVCYRRNGDQNELAITKML